MLNLQLHRANYIIFILLKSVHVLEVCRYQRLNLNIVVFLAYCLIFLFNRVFYVICINIIIANAFINNQLSMYQQTMVNQ